MLAQISLCGFGILSAPLSVADTTGGDDLAPCTGKPLSAARTILELALRAVHLEDIQLRLDALEQAVRS